MIITYTDIANEIQEIKVPLENLDVGTASFMEWFKEQSKEAISFENHNTRSAIFTTDNSKDVSDFDFSSADIVNVYDNYDELRNSLLILIPNDNSAYSYLAMDNEELTEEFFNSINPSPQIKPQINLFKGLGSVKNNYTEKWNIIKTNLGEEKINDIRYGLCVVRIANLNVDVTTAINSIQGVSFDD